MENPRVESSRVESSRRFKGKETRRVICCRCCLTW